MSNRASGNEVCRLLRSHSEPLSKIIWAQVRFTSIQPFIQSIKRCKQYFCGSTWLTFQKLEFQQLNNIGTALDISLRVLFSLSSTQMIALSPPDVSLINNRDPTQRQPKPKRINRIWQNQKLQETRILQETEAPFFKHQEKQSLSTQ